MTYAESRFVRYLLMLLMVLSGSVVVGAQEEGEAVAETPKQDLGRWWLRPARSYDPIPEDWLYHAEGEIFYTRQSGNMDGYEIDGGGRLILRKKIVNQLFYYAITKQDIDIVEGNAGTLKHESQGFEYELRVELNKMVRAEAGAMWERDDSRLIDNRFMYYAGLGAQLVDQPKVKFNTVGAIGQQYDRYAVPIPGVPNPPDNDFTGGYLSLELHWIPNQQVVWRNRLLWFQDLGDSANRRWQFNSAANIQVTSFMGVVLSWETKYNNRQPQLPAFLGFQLNKRDDKQKVGLQFFM